ncbi:regulator of chromosome condensation 1/beta-lactamase-inhibitor protein II, partial [Baffinella frigidus]
LTERGCLVVFGASEYGALGLGHVKLAASPTRISSRILALRTFVSCAVGDDHCAAVTAKGGVYTWGQGCFGALGKPALHRLLHPPDCLRPFRLKLPEEARGRQVCCGANYTAITCRDDVSCGANYTAITCRDGALFVLGDGDTTVRPVRPARVDPEEEREPLECVEAVCGRFHTLVLLPLDQVDELRAPEGLLSRLLITPLRSLVSSLWG